MSNEDPSTRMGWLEGKSDGDRRAGPADVVSAQLTSRGVKVANRTDFPILMEIELTSPSGQMVQGLRFHLDPREEGLIPPDRMGVAGQYELPHPVKRHWSHDRGLVYEGGELRLGLLCAVFLDKERYLAGTEIGRAERDGGLNLGAFITGSEIAAALEN